MTPAAILAPALAACPFCGSDQQVQQYDTNTRRLYVHCSMCGASIFADSRDRAVMLWNARAAPSGLALAHMILADCTDTTPAAWIEAATALVAKAGAA